jgi:tetratricopeptide (TPR) repeat protein
LQSLAAAPDSRAAARLYLGRIEFDSQNFDRAARHLEASVAADNRSAAAHYWLGRAYAAQAENANPLNQAVLSRKMKREFEAAVALQPDDIDARWALMEFHARAPFLLGGSNARAREQAREIARRDAWRGFHAAARLAHLAGDVAGEEKQYVAAARALPDRVEPLIALGLLYQDRQKYGKAFDEFERALKIDPHSGTALFQIGRTAVFSGERIERGVEAIRSYLSMTPGKNDPPLARAHFRLGQLYQKQGKREMARSAFREAVRLEPALRTEVTREELSM